MTNKKITSPQELKNLRNKARTDLDLRSGPKEVRITVHLGTCGIAAGARDILIQLASELAQASADNVTLRQAGCAGLCDQEPMLTLTDAAGKEFRYGRLDKRKVHDIVREHVLEGNPRVDYLIHA